MQTYLILHHDVSFIPGVNWGERSEPHTCGLNENLSIYLYVYMFIWYVRIPYMNSTLFVRDAIFPHVFMY